MRSIILILLFLATIAVTSWYLFPEKRNTLIHTIRTSPENIDILLDNEDVYSGVVQRPAHIPEQPLAEVEDARYEDVIEVVGADIFTLSPGSVIGRVRKEDGISYPGTINITEGRVAVRDDEVIAGAFALDMLSLSVNDENKELLLEMKGEEYLHVEAYPTASFVLQEVNPDQVSGVLTLKNVSKKVTFPALVMISDNKMRIFSDFSIDRTERGIISPSPNINIYLDLHIEWILTKVS